MRRVILLIFALSISFATFATKTFSIPDSRSKGLSEKWVESTFNSSTPPFSFYLDNQHSSTFIKKWKREFKKISSYNNSQAKYNVLFTSPTGDMVITCDIVLFKDYPAIEWKLYFKNNGESNSKKIRDISCSDIALPFGKRAKYTIYTAKGTSLKEYDFHPVKKEIVRDTTCHFANFGGKSTTGDGFPYYNVTADNNRGAMIAIGWTGNWRCDFALDKSNAITMSAGMPNQDMFLYPGEQFRTPSTIILFWNGKERIDGNNYWRKFMLTHYTPKDSKGNMFTPPTSGCFDYRDPKPMEEYEGLTELFALACIERYKRFEMVPDVIWLDAGWYGDINAPYNEPRIPWYRQVGSWVPNPDRFPNGIKPISDAARKIGAKFMLWYEPETVSINTIWDKELPKEWILRSKTYRPKDAIINLAIPEARKYVTTYIINSLYANGVDYYRQDFNLYPNHLWPLADTPDRKGATEVHYVEGLYEFLDEIKREFPDMLIDNCAGGGMRLDIEMMSRSFPLWRTDCNYGEPNSQQSHCYGISQYIPVHGTGIMHADDYFMHSSLSPTLVFLVEMFGRNVELAQLQKIINTHKKYKSYFLADYYPLCGDGSTLGKDINLATQWNRPSDDSGLIILFRRDESPNESITVNLKGLDSNAIYRVKDTDSGEITEYRGAELMNGVTFKIGPKRSSRLLHYSK